MRRIIKIGVLVMVIGLVAYSASCVYANFIAPGPTTATSIKLPEAKTAQYSVTVQSNGNVLFTSNYEKFGQVYVLHGYWEMVGRDSRFRDRDIVLDEAIFGKIIVTKRPIPTATPGVQNAR